MQLGVRAPSPTLSVYEHMFDYSKARGQRPDSRRRPPLPALSSALDGCQGDLPPAALLNAHDGTRRPRPNCHKKKGFTISAAAAKFARMKFPNAYEAKHLKAHEPAKHLKEHEPAKHLKAPDISKTPAWATVIAGTGVAVTLVGATTGQFHGIIKPNQSAVGQKLASDSAVRQLLNATNIASASSAMAKHSLSHAAHQARSATPDAKGNVSRALTSKSSTTLRVGSTGGLPASLRDEHLAVAGPTLLAAVTTTAPQRGDPRPHLGGAADDDLGSGGSARRKHVAPRQQRSQRPSHRRTRRPWAPWHGLLMWVPGRC